MIENGTSSRATRSQHMMLTAFREEGALTRAQLSRATGLSRSAVADAVQALLAAGLLTEHNPPTSRSARGRPTTRLSLALPKTRVIGVDFGHVHVTVAVADGEGTVLAERREDLDVDGQPQLALDTAAKLVKQVIQDASLTLDDIRGVCAGIPGPVDVRTNIVRSPTILSEWTGLDPAKELGERIGLAVTVRNDADMGALGELHYGAASGKREFIYIKASHGVGAGIVINGQSYRGSIGIAGEIGHTQIAGMTNYCRCGNRGCLETVISTAEVQRQLGRVLSPAELTKIGGTLSRVGNYPAAAHVLTDAGRTLGRVLADACNLLNPEAFIIGGQLGEAGEPFVAGIRESLNRYAQETLAHSAEVLPAQLGLRAELLGAIALALQTVRLEKIAPTFPHVAP